MALLQSDDAQQPSVGFFSADTDACASDIESVVEAGAALDTVDVEVSVDITGPAATREDDCRLGWLPPGPVPGPGNDVVDTVLAKVAETSSGMPRTPTFVP